MKTKMSVRIIFFTAVIVGINIWLWSSPESNSELSNNPLSNIKKPNSGVILSDDAEYSAPVKQLQKALAQARQDDDVSDIDNWNNIDVTSLLEEAESDKSDKLNELKSRLARLKMSVNKS